MAKFEPAVNWCVDHHEGGFSNVSHDRGGKTKFGITAVVAKRWGFTDVAALTIAQAKSIYRAGYWRHDDIESQSIATKAFDIGVNVGVDRGIQLMQRAVNRLMANGAIAWAATSPPPLKEDGLLGPTTEGVINDICRVPTFEHLLLDALREVQVLYYAEIINGNAKELNRLIKLGHVPADFKNQATFVLGWMRRALDLP